MNITGVVKVIVITLDVLVLRFSDNPDARIFAGIGIICLAISLLLESE